MHALQQTGIDKIILTNNISVISLDKERKRVVFNFMNNIHVFGRWTPDYHYFQYNNAEEAEKAYKKIIELPHFKINFFVSNNENNFDIINKKAITSISIKENEQKIIFNLNYSITSYKNNKAVEISKFVFWSYSDDDVMDDDRLDILADINNLLEI